MATIAMTATMATTAMMTPNGDKDNKDQAATTARVKTTAARATATGARRVTATMATMVTTAMPNSNDDAKQQ